MNYSKGRKIYITISAILVAVVAIIIFYLSAQNGEESSSVSSSLIALIFSLIGQTFSQNFIRTLAHFCEFAGLGFLIHNLIFAIKNKLQPLFCGLFSFGYAVTDEIHQIFVPGRAFQLIDLAVDLGGIVLGTAVFCVIIIIVKYKKAH